MCTKGKNLTKIIEISNRIDRAKVNKIVSKFVFFFLLHI